MPTARRLRRAPERAVRGGRRDPRRLPVVCHQHHRRALRRRPERVHHRARSRPRPGHLHPRRRAARGRGRRELVFNFAICRRAGRGTVSRPVSAGVAARRRPARTTPRSTAARSSCRRPGPGQRARRAARRRRPKPYETVLLTGFPGSGTIVAGRARGFIADDDRPAQGTIFYERDGQILALDRDAQEPRTVTPVASRRSPSTGPGSRSCARPRRGTTSSGSRGRRRRGQAIFAAAGAGARSGRPPGLEPGRHAAGGHGARGRRRRPAGQVTWSTRSDEARAKPVGGPVEPRAARCPSRPTGRSSRWTRTGRSSGSTWRRARARGSPGQTPSYGRTAPRVSAPSSCTCCAAAPSPCAPRPSGAPGTRASTATSARRSPPTASPSCRPRGRRRAPVGADPEPHARQPARADDAPRRDPGNPAWAPATGDVPPPAPTVSVAEAAAAEGDPWTSRSRSRARPDGRDRHGDHDHRDRGRRRLHGAQRMR